MQSAGPAALAFALLVSSTPSCMAGDPKLPAGTDPGGVAVALISTGLDYTRPEIAGILARDGEGDLIGWDFVDNDNRPYAPMSAANQSKAKGRSTWRSPARLVPVRIQAEKSAMFTNALGFVSRTPARIVAVTTSADSRENRETLARAASRLPDHLFLVAPNPNVTRATGKASLRAFDNLPNVVVVWASQYRNDRLPNPLRGGFVADAELWRALRAAACIETELSAIGLSDGAGMKSKVLESGVLEQKGPNDPAPKPQATPCGPQGR